MMKIIRPYRLAILRSCAAGDLTGFQPSRELGVSRNMFPETEIVRNTIPI